MVPANHHHLALPPQLENPIQNRCGIPAIVNQIPQEDQTVLGTWGHPLQQALESMQTAMDIPHRNQSTGRAHANLFRPIAGQ
jgi:hypothetical protein